MNYRIIWYDRRGVDFRIEEVETADVMEEKLASPPLTAVSAHLMRWNKTSQKFVILDYWYKS